MNAGVLPSVDELWQILEGIAPNERYAIVSEALGFRSTALWEPVALVGWARAALANIWECLHRSPVPFREIGKLIESQRNTEVRAQLWALAESGSFAAFSEATNALFLLLQRATAIETGQQQQLFYVDNGISQPGPNVTKPGGAVFSDLNLLLGSGKRFRTIYADPPWPYDNEADRGAAVKHYPVMSLDDIRRVPVSALAAKSAHLHLWSTNGFLREALELIDAWEFKYKSCFVWVKPDLGCGNYWRVSHEFLLLGVRGRLPFRDRAQQSWLAAPRLEHSRKPGRVRLLIERVSPGPYLELYGRAAVPDSDWTVFGNQVEKRLF